MTRKQETAKTAKPDPVELHDEALDKVDGGSTPSRLVGLGDGSVRSGTAGAYTFSVIVGNLPSG